MATHALVPSAAVVPTPAELPFAVGAIMGCGVMTGFGSAVNAAQVARGSSVVVLGCGGVGLSVILGAGHRGASRAFAVDLSEPRLELARHFGATDVMLADRADVGLT